MSPTATGRPKRIKAGKNKDDLIPAALGHPLRQEILRLAAEQRISAKWLSDRRWITHSLGTCAYHVRVLADAGLLVEVEQEMRRGAIKHWYRTTPEAGPALADMASVLHKLAFDLGVRTNLAFIDAKEQVRGNVELDGDLSSDTVKVYDIPRGTKTLGVSRVTVDFGAGD